MPRITVNVFPADLAYELKEAMDTRSLEYLIHDLVSGIPNESLEALIRDLQTIHRERKEMDGE